MEINLLVLENLLFERTFKTQMYRRSAQSQKARAQAGKIRQLSRGSNLQQQISITRLKLNKLLDRQRQMYSGRARSAVMRGWLERETNDGIITNDMCNVCSNNNDVTNIIYVI